MSQVYVAVTEHDRDYERVYDAFALIMTPEWDTFVLTARDEIEGGWAIIDPVADSVCCHGTLFMVLLDFWTNCPGCEFTVLDDLDRLEFGRFAHDLVEYFGIASRCVERAERAARRSGSGANGTRGVRHAR